MELILQRIIDEASENFGKEFLEHYLSGSFGSMSKSENGNSYISSTFKKF